MASVVLGIVISAHGYACQKTALRRLARGLRMAGGDDGERKAPTMMEDNDKPKIAWQDEEEAKPKAKAASSSSSSNTLGSFDSNKLFNESYARQQREQQEVQTKRDARMKTLLGKDKDKSKNKNAPTSAVFGSMSIEDLKGRMQETDGNINMSWDDLPDRTEDLNGINPFTTTLFSVFPIIGSIAFFKATVWLSQHFAIDYVDSEVYPVQVSVPLNFSIMLASYVIWSGALNSSGVLLSYPLISLA